MPDPKPKPKKKPEAGPKVAAKGSSANPRVKVTIGDAGIYRPGEWRNGEPPAWDWPADWPRVEIGEADITPEQERNAVSMEDARAGWPRVEIGLADITPEQERRAVSLRDALASVGPPQENEAVPPMRPRVPSTRIPARDYAAQFGRK